MKNINCRSSCCSYINYLLSYLFTPAFFCFVCLFFVCFLFLVKFQTICDAYTQESAANETKRAKKVLQVSKT